MPEIDTGDTAWLLMSTALVMFMTPGLALFYGGLVRTKNVLGTIMQSFIALGVVSVLWVLIGYTLAFGDSQGGLIGGLDFLGFSGVGGDPNPDYAATIPHGLFGMYQMMFAIITPALISGAIAERMKFSGYVLFIALWSLLVYSPVAHWVFGYGWLGTWNGIGALDFAGGTVVHINAGAAALAAIFFLGKRRGFGKDAFVPHNVPMVITGAAILWFGWFGFNAGSALAAGGLAVSAFTATHVATAAAILGWLIPETIRHGRPTTIGAATGAVAGLVAITPAAGFVEPIGAILIGLAAGVICWAAVEMKSRLRYDDSLDVVGVHLVGGIVGALLTGLLASTAVNTFEGGFAQLGRQAIGVGATLAFSFVATWVILWVVDKLVGVRVSEDDEVTGLDLSQHAEVGYSLVDRGGSIGSGTPGASASVMVRDADTSVKEGAR